MSSQLNDPAVGQTVIDMSLQRVIVADDHPLFRDALSNAVQSGWPACDILAVGSFDELEQSLSRAPDIELILLDLTMPGVQGLSGLLQLRAEYPAIPVIVVSASDDPMTIRRCMDFGASGFVPKSAPDGRIREAVRSVLAGQLWSPPELDIAGEQDKEERDLIARLATLTPQHVRVLMLLDDEGVSNKEIAFRFGIKESTIKAHVSQILKRLGVDNRTQASNLFKRVSTLDWQKTKD